MQINADLRKRAVEYGEQLPWVASPLPGVERRMLERDGDEVARATTIVRYAPGSYFDETAAWSPGEVEGLSVLRLHVHGSEQVAALRLEPGTRLGRTTYPAGVEVFVLDGVLADERGQYPAGTWLRQPPKSELRLFSESGCTLYVKVGHLCSTDS